MTSLRNIRRIFAPSRQIAHYLGRMFLLRFMALLIGLTAVLQLLDLMATYDELMRAEGATWYGQVSHYLRLRIPQLVSQFIPFTALLATLLSLATLSQHSEIIVMKVAGLSAHKVLAPLGLVSFLIGGLHLTFNELVVVGASADLRYWEDNGYAVGLPPPPEYVTGVRIVDGNTLILAEAVNRNGNVLILDKVSLYERDEMGTVTGLLKANFGAFVDGSWSLFEARRFDVDTLETEFIDNLPWQTSISPDRFLAASVQPDLVSLPRLFETIDQLESQGRPANALRSAALHRMTGPLASLLMPLLGAIAGFGIHRAGTLLIRLVAGMALGFAFFVADNFMLAMGKFGVAPPFLAAAAPFLLFLTVGFAVLFYTEE